MICGGGHHRHRRKRKRLVASGRRPLCVFHKLHELVPTLGALKHSFVLVGSVTFDFQQKHCRSALDALRVQDFLPILDRLVELHQHTSEMYRLALLPMNRIGASE
jgi:hypothetical protein